MSTGEFEVPDFFDPDEWAVKAENKSYVQKPIGKWIYIQAELGQVVIPKVSEVIPVEDEDHSVMWAERITIDEGRCLSCHQIVCDCVMDMTIEDVDKGNFNCRAVDKFIRWGAEITRQAKHLDVLLGFYGNIGAGLAVKEGRNLREGDKVLETIFEKLLEETKYHPENWVGNKLGGTHSITGLSYVVGQERKRTLEVIEGMQATKPIELRENETVILRAA